MRDKFESTPNKRARATCPFSRNQKILPFLSFIIRRFSSRGRGKKLSLSWDLCGSHVDPSGKRERFDRARKSRGLKPKKFVDRRWWSKMVVISCFLAQRGGEGERNPCFALPPARLGRLIALEGRLITDRIKRKKKERERREEDENLSALFSRRKFFPFSSSSKSRGSCV